MLDEVGEWVELHVDKRIRYRHGRNDHDVHEDGENNNLSVEANQSVVFGEPVGNEVESDGTQKEPVESKVDNQVEGLFDSIPIRVNIAVLLTNLQTRWNPNIKNGNVDDCNEKAVLIMMARDRLLSGMMTRIRLMTI